MQPNARPQPESLSLEQAEFLLEHVPSPVWITRGNRILFANRAGLELIGVTRDSLEGVNFQDRVQLRSKQTGLAASPADQQLFSNLEAIVKDNKFTEHLVKLSGWPIVLEDGPAVQFSAEKHSVSEPGNADFGLSESLGGVARWEWNLDTNEVYWSDGQYVLQGLKPGSVKPTYELWKQALFPDDVERVEQIATEAIAANRDYQFEYRIRSVDGSVRWLEARGHMVPAQPGSSKVRRAVGVTVDITDRKLAELELERVREEARRRHNDLEQIYRTVPVGLAYMDAQLRYVYVNELMARLNGKPAAEHVGKTVHEVLPPHIAQYAHEKMSEVLRTGRPLPELEISAEIPETPGVTRDWLVHYFPVGTPEISGLHVIVQETTEHKLTEAAIRESGERLQIALDAAATGTFRWDIRTNSLVWDRNLNRLFGLPEEDDVQNLDRFLSLVHPDDRERVVEGCRQCATTGIDFDMEYRVVWSDGSLHWLYDRGKTFFDQDGTPAYMTGACVDITDRKMNEIELRVGEETLRLALQSGASGTFEWNIPENINKWSPEIEELYGFPRGGFPGRYEDWTVCVHPDDLAQAEAAARASFVTGDLSAEWRIYRQDTGALRWMSARGKVLRDESGTPIRMLGLNTDITERKIIEQELRRSAQILNQIHDAVIATDLAGSITLWNNGAELQFGYSAEEAIGKNISMLYFPEEREDLMNRILHPLKNKGMHELEVRNRRKNGTQFFGHLSLSTLNDENGIPIGIISYTMDLTEKKRAEHALRVSEKLAATGRLASTLAHEINNPLEALTNIVFLLRHSYLRGKELEDSLGMAESELSRISNITRNLLSFHRQPIQPVEVVLPTLIEEVLSLHRAKLDAKQISVRTRLRQDGTLRAYSGELRQVISNLITNAIEASPVGGKIRIGVSTIGTPEAPCMQLTVADNGQGIRKEVIGQIFEPFYTTKGDKGSGLGLWVTKDLVEKHGGKINVRSTSLGTCFVVRIPVGHPAKVLERAV